MRRRANILLPIVGLAVCLVPAPRGSAAEVHSPDRAVRFRVFADRGRLHFTVTFKGQAVIEPSPLRILVDGVDLADGADAGPERRYEVKETYATLGVHAKAVNHCNGVEISYNHPRLKGGWKLEARAFNDGVGFRHVIPGDAARTPDEGTTFLLPDGSKVWYHDLGGHYEGVHVRKDLGAVKAEEWAALPLTFKLSGKLGYVSITEAALLNYSGMALQADGRRGFTVVLGHKHPISYPFRLRFEKDIPRVSKPAVVSGTITSPWRVVLVGADLNALVNSDIVTNLCPPPDPKLFPRGVETEWIKPGRAVWRYLDGGKNTFDDMKEFSRLAGKLGFEHHVVEGFWARWSDEQVRALVDESRKHGVGLYVWRHSNQLRTPEAREAFFKRLHALGIVGAKLDFFDHEHKEIVDLYTELLAAAAKYRIMVNFHGSNKPTGLQRTWPNELVREAVRGMEARKLPDRATHNTTLPFTRYLAGPADYTAVHFGDRRANTTWAHQIASAAVFTAPSLLYGAHPEAILKNPGAEMMQSIPAVWDETAVLPPSEIGDMAVFARRKGKQWFLAVLNGKTVRALRIPLSFLGPGEHDALVVRDAEGDPAAVRVESATARRDTAVAIELSAGGGFIARYSPK
jgi:alpha-glucosidase